MQAALVLDQQAGVMTLADLPPEYHGRVKPRTNAKGNIEWWYPKGTIFDGEQAVFLCKTGQAKPIDQECADACGMTPTQLRAAQIEYEMDSIPLTDKKERQLYAAGIINGIKDGKYVKGKNWDAHAADIGLTEESIAVTDE